eukprot:jgi/Bigna1/64561/fgenesh1_kg.78_\
MPELFAHFFWMKRYCFTHHLILTPALASRQNKSLRCPAKLRFPMPSHYKSRILFKITVFNTGLSQESDIQKSIAKMQSDGTTLTDLLAATKSFGKKHWESEFPYNSKSV